MLSRLHGSLKTVPKDWTGAFRRKKSSLTSPVFARVGVRAGGARAVPVPRSGPVGLALCLLPVFWQSCPHFPLGLHSSTGTVLPEPLLGLREQGDSGSSCEVWPVVIAGGGGMWFRSRCFHPATSITSLHTRFPHLPLQASPGRAR